LQPGSFSQFTAPGWAGLSRERSGVTRGVLGAKRSGGAGRYVFAALVVALAAVVQSSLQQAGAAEFGPFASFCPAVLLVTVVAGSGPGVVATVLSALAANYWFLGPMRGGAGTLTDVAGLAIFVGVCLSVCGLVERLRRTTATANRRGAADPAVDALDVGTVMVRDMDDRIIRWGAGCRQLYGFDTREAEGRLSHELLHTRLPQPLEQVRRALLERGCWEGELMQRRKDGADVTVASRWVLRRDGAGRPVSIVAADTDITQRKRAEERCGESEERHRVLIETTLEGVVRFDSDGKVIAVNASAERILGISATELLGRTPASRGWQMVREDGSPLPLLDHPALLALQTGRRVNDALVGVWNPHVQAYRWLSMTAVPLLHGEESRPFEVYLVLAEVTERQRADEAAQRAAERHETALDAAIMGTWEYHPDSGSLFWDRRCRSMFGVGFGDRVEFRAILELVHAEDRARVETEFSRALDPGSSGAYESEYRVVWPDGSIHWVNAIGQAYFKGTGDKLRAVRFIGTTLDITQRKELEQERDALLASERAARTEAERANRLKDEFVATLSHELRNPLNVILGWVQILERSQRSAADVNQAIQMIRGSGGILAELISELLDMSRITSGKLLLDKQTVDPRAVITAALETAKPAIEAKEIYLEAALDQAGGRVHGDPNRLRQVVWNLLSNAVKFTGRGGRISVQTARCDSRLEISVSDTGQGIDPEFLPHIFERFRQEDASAARKHGGLGLGLSISRSLVEMHGGSIKVTSAGKGRGATFTVTLPMLADDTGEDQSGDGTQPAAEPEPLDSGDASLAELKVLAVDDDRDSLEIVKRVLEERHATVFTAASAATGLELFQRVRPDVLISDIGMPEEDGYRFLRRVRALDADRGGGTPAIALTAFAGPDDRRRAMLCGYQAHLTKPVEALRLVATVASLAQKSCPATGKESGTG
jgi:PAS domain S-box-containing protein